MLRSPQVARTLRAAGATLLAICMPWPTLAAEATPWALAGRQGIIRLVIVPAAQAQDRAAYDQQIAAFCKGQETCFINFFTNSTNAEVAVPLPDAIDKEATAVLRRSAKQGVDSLRWSCRLKRPDVDCF